VDLVPGHPEAQKDVDTDLRMPEAPGSCLDAVVESEEMKEDCHPCRHPDRGHQVDDR
jgi:hypothetical protein